MPVRDSVVKRAVAVVILFSVMLATAPAIVLTTLAAVPTAAMLTTALSAVR